MKLKVAHLYPDLLNLYGDSGNILCIKKRCEWREIACSVTPLIAGRDFDFSDYDLIFIGGGQDREQKLVLRDLTVKKGIHCIMRLKTAQSCSPSAAAISCLADFMKLLPANIWSLQVFLIFIPAPGKNA